MKIIRHRVNSSKNLLKIPRQYGTEIDLRWSHDLGIYLSHDPNSSGEVFRDWLKSYNHGTLILNVKEDGIEQEILELMDSFSIREFFFLDQPIPTLIKCIINKVPTAIRLSEYEVFPQNLPANPEWLWVDSFTGSWEHLTNSLEIAANLNLKICIVSPELQGRNSACELNEIKSKIGDLWSADFVFVCTKNPENWLRHE
jgi:hypothetical protein